MDQYDDLPTSISAISMSDFYGFTAPRWATSLVVGRVQRSLCFKTCSTGQELATARSLGRTSVGNFYNYRLLITGVTNLADLYQETITLVLT